MPQLLLSTSPTLPHPPFVFGAGLYGTFADELTFLPASSELKNHHWAWLIYIVFVNHDIVCSSDEADVVLPVALFEKPEETAGPP